MKQLLQFTKVNRRKERINQDANQS